MLEELGASEEAAGREALHGEHADVALDKRGQDSVDEALVQRVGEVDGHLARVEDVASIEHALVCRGPAMASEADVPRLARFLCLHEHIEHPIVDVRRVLKGMDLLEIEVVRAETL